MHWPWAQEPVLPHKMHLLLATILRLRMHILLHWVMGQEPQHLLARQGQSSTVLTILMLELIP